MLRAFIYRAIIPISCVPGSGQDDGLQPGWTYDHALVMRWAEWPEVVGFLTGHSWNHNRRLEVRGYSTTASSPSGLILRRRDLKSVWPALGLRRRRQDFRRTDRVAGGEN